jgi:glycosidase
MRVHDDYKTWNIEAQRKDPNSVWSFWKRMLSLRHEYEALVYGESGSGIIRVVLSDSSRQVHPPG